MNISKVYPISENKENIPIIESERANFFSPTQSDYEDIFSLYNNEETRKYLGGIVERKEFEKKFIDLFSAKLPECHFVIREKESNSIIGMVSITRHHDQEHFEISYELHPNFWGKGLGTEVSLKIIEYAFSELGLKELIAETQKKNQTSVKLLEKIGMTFVKEIERFGEKQVIYTIKL